MNMQHKRILVISFSYRPLNNPRAFRWTHLSEKIAAAGHSVDVVTSWVPGCSDTECSGNLSVHRAGWKFLERARGQRRLAREQAGKVTMLGTSSLLAKARQALLKGANWLWRNLYWPDPSCLWFFPARQMALALIAQKQYDVVISVSPTFTAVAVGHSVRKHVKDSVWLLDLGDPFSFLEGAPPNNATLYAGLNRWYERKVFRQADVISVTNPQTQQRYAEVFPESAAKLLVIPPLLSLPQNGSKATVLGRLVYVGTMYRNIREPGFLLELFGRALEAGLNHEFELHCYGDVSSCLDIITGYESLLGKHVFFHGVVSRDVAAQALDEAQFLINIGNETTYQLPSKVVEYAATGKPVINLAKSSMDSSVGFFAAYPCALNLINSMPLPDEAAVADFVRFTKETPQAMERTALAAWLSPYTSDNVVAAYLNAMNRKY
jgi:glycosyltransferase involved in cell wall biosynthesis